MYNLVGPVVKYAKLAQNAPCVYTLRYIHGLLPTPRSIHLLWRRPREDKPPQTGTGNSKSAISKTRNDYHERRTKTAKKHHRRINKHTTMTSGGHGAGPQLRIDPHSLPRLEINAPTPELPRGKQLHGGTGNSAPHCQVRRRRVQRLPPRR